MQFILSYSVTYKGGDYRHFEVPAAALPAAYIDPILLQHQRDENAVFAAHAVAAAAAAHARLDSITNDALTKRTDKRHKLTVKRKKVDNFSAFKS